MKKFIMIALMLGLGTSGWAAVKTDSTKSDNDKIITQVKKLNEKLADLQTELNKIQNRLPDEQSAAEEALGNSNKAQEKSRKQAASAVGGDAGDTRKAAKLAKKAANETGDAEDAAEKVEK